MKKLLFTLLLFAACGSQAEDGGTSPAPGTKEYDITDFGASGDGTTLSTDAIQRAIDRCSAEGGGTVCIPRGRFLSGTLQLKSGVTLHLAEGAVLLGSTKMEDYTPSSLIRAKQADDIGITGPGTIDGQGSHFWYRKPTGHYDHLPERPGCMVYLEDCRNVRVENVRLQNSESWTLHLLGCTGATVRGVTVRNPLHGPNTDGIDIQASSDVHVSECDIYTGDDAIVLKHRHSKYYDRICENVTVTGCVLTTTCNALKIGTETLGEFRNITFRDCTVRAVRPDDSLARIRLEAGLPARAISGISVESVDGSHIRDVRFDNIEMEEVRAPIFVRLANRGAGDRKGRPKVPGSIRNVTISRVSAGSAWYASSITAIPGYAVEEVTLSDIRITTAGGGDEALAEKSVDERIESYPDAHMWKELPASALYVHHARGIGFDGIRISLEGTDRRPVLICDDVRDFRMEGLKADDRSEGEALIRLQETKGALFGPIDTGSPCPYLFDLRGTGCTDIRTECPSSRIKGPAGTTPAQI